MARPNLSGRRRKELLPVVAEAFAELGYRRTTTAELARRCSIRENILYRLWQDKKAMFVAAIEFVFDQSACTWQEILDQEAQGTSSAERILEYESRHHGESDLYRIVFAGLSETDDAEIRKALRRMYARFQRFVRQQIGAHRNGSAKKAAADADLSAWAVLGLGTVANITQELGLIAPRRRRQLIAETGRLLLEAGRD